MVLLAEQQILEMSHEVPSPRSGVMKKHSSGLELNTNNADGPKTRRLWFIRFVYWAEK